jgi:hypothetical protein
MTSIIKKGKLFGITNLSLLWLNQNKRDDKIAKTDDRIKLSWGKSQRRLVLFVVFNFKTQMDAGLDKDDLKISQLFSPAYFQFGPGMLWKKVIT